jgi:hypothetical protein
VLPVAVWNAASDLNLDSVEGEFGTRTEPAEKLKAERQIKLLNTALRQLKVAFNRLVLWSRLGFVTRPSSFIGSDPGGATPMNKASDLSAPLRNNKLKG